MRQLPVPVLIRRLDDGAAIEIQWDDAGHTGIYGARDLRLACQCAVCRDEMTGRPLMDAASVASDIRAAALRLVGGYAVQFDWSDGHNSGIYPWELLLRICPCPACAGARKGGEA